MPYFSHFNVFLFKNIYCTYTFFIRKNEKSFLIYPEAQIKFIVTNFFLSTDHFLTKFEEFNKNPKFLLVENFIGGKNLQFFNEKFMNFFL